MNNNNTSIHAFYHPSNLFFSSVHRTWKKNNEDFTPCIHTIIIVFTMIFTLPLLGQSGPVDSLIISLYSGPIPNSLGSIEEIVDQRPDGGRFISNTTHPTLTYFRPANPKSQAIIICPGGGYRGVAIDKEGFRVAREMQKKGYHAFVLKYRTPNDASCKDKSIAPLQDAQQALKMAQDSLHSWGYADVSIGLMGFSAGGHLAATGANAYNYDLIEDKEQRTIRPDFSILLYPVITMERPYTHEGSRKNLLGVNPTSQQLERFSAQKKVNEQTPPTFIVHASDDTSVPVQNSLLYYEACVQNNVPVEMHLYTHGGHGFGLVNKTTEDVWLERLFNWLKTLD